jgi:DNA-binding CsgD family transcriptional regulator
VLIVVSRLSELCPQAGAPGRAGTSWNHYRVSAPERAMTLWGRDTELAALARGLDTAAAGTGCLLVVEGPAGIGKTALLDAATTAAAGRGLAVLRARGNPLEQGFSYGIARQSFAPVPWSGLCTGPAAHARRALDDEPPETGNDLEAMYAATHGLFWLTASYAARTPVVLCVDDAHWADPPSLRWLVTLARRVDEIPVALLLAVRSGEPSTDPLALGELLAAAAPIRPPGLDLSSAGALIRATRPDATPEFVRTCHEAGGGNPFLIKVLADTGAAGPVRVGRWVDQHLAHLPASATALARALALLGTGARLRHAADLAGCDTGEAAALTDAMRASGLLAPEGPLSLAHPVVAAALYEGIGPGVRGLWHARAARLLAAGPPSPGPATDGPATPGPATPGPSTPGPDAGHPAAFGSGRAGGADRLDGDPERAALHLLHAEPAGDPFATGLLRVAARHATARGAPETAATFLQRALAEPPAGRDDDTAVRLDLALALAAHRQPAAPDLARQVVAGIADPVDRATAALRCGRALAMAGDLPSVAALYRLVLKDPSGVPEDVLARVRAEWAANAITDSRTRTTASAIPDLPGQARTTVPDLPGQGETAPDLAGQDGTAVPGGPGGTAVAGGLWRVRAASEATFAGRPPAACAGLLLPLLDTGELDEETDSLLPTAAAIMLIASGEFARARALSDAMIAGGEARGWLSAIAHGRFLRALTLLPAGKVTAAATEARASLEFKLDTGTTQAPALLWALTPLVAALTEADRPIEAATAAAHVPEPPPYAFTSPMFLQVRAGLRLDGGRPGEALADLLDAAARWEDLGIAHPALASWRAGAVRAHLALGDAGEARRIAAEQLVAAERTGAPEALSTALRSAALADRGARRLELLDRAVRVSAGTEARLAHAYARFDLGCALRRAGRRTAARDPLLAALEIAHAGGAARLAGRALAESHAAGARPRRPSRHGTEALTDAERQVAGLAAGGLTNRQISDRLTLSRRTVETHLAHAYRKLEIHSRTELAGLLPE